MPVSPDRVVEYLRTRAGRPLKSKELARGLGVAASEYAEFRALLGRLEDEGVVYRVRQQRYAAPEKINLLTGRLQTIRSGAGFVIPEDGAADLFVPTSGLGSAVDGDRVVARVERWRRGQRQEGRIIKVLERAREKVVGVYHPARNFGFVVPEDVKLVRDIFVPPGQERGAVDGDVVVLQVTNWGDEHLGPAGEVEQVLGRLGEPGVDVLAVIHDHGLPLEFPREVEAEAERIRERGMQPPDLADRLDLRELLVFTIDPADAKDHDDALSIRPLGEDRWEVGVHIADVAFYVRESSLLDAEALRRGTSTYLVDRVLPMLPEPLSSDLCSLRPDEDRLALSLLLELDGDARPRRAQLVRSVIRSRHRLSYEQAQLVLDGEASVDAATDAALRELLRIGRMLRAAREARGSLDFDLPEARVVLNTQGEPTDIQRVLRLESHRLIEDFMLLANETVARKAASSRLPFLYRIHESPDPDRLEQLAEFVGTFGLQLARGAQAGPREVARLLAAAKGRPEENLLSTVVLRSMKQARYSHLNAGHFGLAAKHYTHFTSPIRRYPDLVVHRLAAAAFIDHAPLQADLLEEKLASIAQTASERERIAVEAERDSMDLKKVEFMERHLGDTFEGTISGVTSFGFFVLLSDFFVEGLVHVSSLEDDYYAFLEEQYALLGERSRRRFQLGDPVRVQVAAVNREERKIDFLLADARPATARLSR
ncbi:MAG: ribonuclease R [Gemmatimonadetes bacterium]|nr:ribonuclease R [Gemmatimonadota bacterium]